MNATKVNKQELIDSINRLEDPDKLESVKFLLESLEDPVVSWDDLSEAERAAIREGREDVKAGQIRPHEKVRKTYEQWL